MHRLRGAGDVVIGRDHRLGGLLQMAEPVGLAGDAAGDFLQVAGDVGKLDAEAADPVGELIDQPFAVRRHGRGSRLSHRHHDIDIRIGSRSQPVRGAEAAPVAALDADRHVDLAHHHGVAVAHVAGVALDQIGALVAPGGKTGRIVEDAAVAAVGGVPGDVARPLRMRIDLVMNRQIAVGVDHGAERHPRVPGEERFLERRQRAIGPVQDFGAVLHRIAACDLDIVGVEHVLDRDGAAGHAVLKNLLQRGAGFHRAGHGLGVVVLDRP